MKHSKTMLAGLILLLAAAMPSMAMAQYGEPRLDHFLDSHPGMKTQLERNPDLIYNRNFRKQHPDLEAFMQNHPNVWGKLAGSGRWGAYGPDHNWHEADWWHEHDPGWLYKNHPEWAENHPDWRADQTNHPEWFRHPIEAMHHEEAVHHEHEEAVHHEEAVEHHHHD
ncbi:MAG: hypothetical protein WCA22_13945 [Candidatus Binatus sp.]